MSKRASIIEWYVADGDADWAAHTSPPGLEMTPSHDHLVSQWFCWQVIAILFLVVGAGWWWYTTQVELRQVKVAVTSPAQGDHGVVEHDGRLLSSSAVEHGRIGWAQLGQTYTELRAVSQTSDPDSHLAIALDTEEVQGNQAVARIVTITENGLPAYQLTRFYRRTASGRLRTESDAALWGPVRSLETPYFLYHFRQHDAQAVIAVAPRVDTLYTTISHNFGLPIVPTPEKLVIEVSVSQPPGQILPAFDEHDRFVVPSPSLYRAPIERTEAELLAQSIALALLDQVLAQANEQYALRANWQLMLSGLYLWQMWDLDLPLAAWREDVVKWVYIDLPAADPGQPVVLPEHYTEICAAHRLWMPSPVQINIPLICAEPNWEKINLSAWSSRAPLTRLDQFGVPMSKVNLSAEINSQGRTIALATLIEYAVATYGRGRLPVLVAGLGQYDSWNTLIPAVFGVSASEFEVGWRTYLADRYAVSIDPNRRDYK